MSISDGIARRAGIAAVAAAALLFAAGCVSGSAAVNGSGAVQDIAALENCRQHGYSYTVAGVTCDDGLDVIEKWNLGTDEFDAVGYEWSCADYGCTSGDSFEVELDVVDE